MTIPKKGLQEPSALCLTSQLVPFAATGFPIEASHKTHKSASGTLPEFNPPSFN